MPNAYHYMSRAGGTIGGKTLNGSGSTTDGAEMCALPIEFGSATDVFVLMSYQHGASGTGDSGHTQFIRETGGADTELSKAIYGLEAADEVRSFSQIFYHQLSADTRYTYSMKSWRSDNVGNMVDLYEPRVTVLEEAAADEKNSSTGRSTTTSTSPQTKLTLTFTPASTRDYLVMGSAILDSSSSTRSVNATIDVDGTDYCTMVQELDNSSYRYPFFGMFRINLDNTEHDIKIEYWSEHSSQTTGIQSAYLVAISMS